MTDHPITPPPELVEKWIKSARYREFMPYPEGYEQYEQRLTTIAARWGADMELEACCQALRVRGTRMRCMEANQTIDQLRAVRRPKPPSLKERALQAWAAVEAGTDDQTAMSVIRQALEQLDD